MYQVRTDLALEAREKFEHDNVEVKGVKVSEEKITTGKFPGSLRKF